MARKKVEKKEGLIHIKEIVDLYNSGLSAKQVGAKLGLSSNVVGKWLAKAGVVTRGGAKVYGLEEYLNGKE